MAPAAPAAGELLHLAIAAATAAGELLLAGVRTARTTVLTKTTVTDMVTEMDHASEALVREHLLGARPDDGFLGEETGLTVGTSGVRWVVDPLDGTTNYLYGFPGWNVSIAAEDEHGAVAAAVVDPLLGDTFGATRGGGAQRNGAPVTCSDKVDLTTALCATGFAYDPARRRAQAAVLVDVIAKVRDIRRGGAAAVDLCSVACGRVDAYWERGLGPWDLAAGSLIAREAGAHVAGDDELGFTLAAPPGIFGPLRDVLVEAGAETA
jgi:myo-inositol-1(or 4)-monophosphatase